MTQTVKKVLRSTGIAMSLSALVSMVPVVTQATGIHINMPGASLGTELTINGKPVRLSPSHKHPEHKHPEHTHPEHTHPNVARHWLSPRIPDSAETELNGKSESVLREISLACPGRGKLYIEGHAYLTPAKINIKKPTAYLSITTDLSEEKATNEYVTKWWMPKRTRTTALVVCEYDCVEGKETTVLLTGKGKSWIASNYSLAITYFSTE
jgi:hypothetical protein